MGLATYFQDDKVAIGQGVTEGPSTLRDVYETEKENTVANLVDINMRSRVGRFSQLKSERLNKYKELTGQELSYKLSSEPDFSEAIDRFSSIDPNLNKGLFTKDAKLKSYLDKLSAEEPKRFQDVETIEDLKDRLIDRHIESMRGKDPRFKDIKTSSEMMSDIYGRAHEARAKADMANRNATTLSRLAGGLGGGFVGALKDPLQVAAMVVGGGPARTALKTILKEAAINAGVEAAQQPAIAKWQAELGNEYGLSDAVSTVGMAGLFGGAVAGGKIVVPKLAKGAHKYASSMWSTAAERTDLTVEAKSTFKTLGRLAHIEENNPLKHLPDVDAGRHIESVNVTADAIFNGRRVRPEDLKISQAEFDKIDTTIKEGVSDIERARLEEIRKFQSDDKPEAVPVKEELPSADQVKANDAVKVAPEKRIKVNEDDVKFIGYQEFGDNDWRPMYNVASLNNTTLTANGLKRNGIPEPKKIPPIAEWRAEQAKLPPQQVMMGEFKPEKPQKQTVAKDILEPDEIKDPKFQDELLEASNAPETIEAEQADFARLLKENPDMQIVFEDRKISLKDLADELKEDESFQKQIAGCASRGVE